MAGSIVLQQEKPLLLQILEDLSSVDELGEQYAKLLDSGSGDIEDNVHVMRYSPPKKITNWLISIFHQCNFLRNKAETSRSS